jgi:hypothetical protein
VFTITSECVSLNDILIFECSFTTGISGSSIVWQGTAFDCPPINEVVILISRFTSISHSCNNETIVGWNVVKPNDSSIDTYTSRLNVTISSDMMGKNITCYYDNGTMENPGSIKIFKTSTHVILYPINLFLIAS